MSGTTFPSRKARTRAAAWCLIRPSDSVHRNTYLRIDTLPIRGAHFCIRSEAYCNSVGGTLCVVLRAGRPSWMSFSCLACVFRLCLRKHSKRATLLTLYERCLEHMVSAQRCIHAHSIIAIFSTHNHILWRNVYLWLVDELHHTVSFKCQPTASIAIFSTANCEIIKFAEPFVAYENWGHSPNVLILSQMIGKTVWGSTSCAHAQGGNYATHSRDSAGAMMTGVIIIATVRLTYRGASRTCNDRV